tara:strand:- start:607 stop:816 length:210 start_codon:yes stop_codon:yes gene_type:complete
MKRYKVKFKVEQIYNVEVEIDNPSPCINERNDLLYDTIIEDYDVGNMDNDMPDESYSIEKVEEIDDKDL